MRSRLALLALAGSLLACQDYRFSPVGRCTIQPGQAQVALSDVTTADVLFVVDDSQSMDPIQANLANNFGAFIGRLAAAQQARTSAGKEALDFYIAVTTSSVLVNEVVGNACGAVTPGQCSIQFPRYSSPYSYACSPAGSACGDVITNFYDGLCTTGVSPGVGQPYFAGDFVAASGNPKVLAFTKSLPWAGYPSASPTDPINVLIGQFQKNVQVGSCGANQEMHLEASRRAVQKAAAGAAANAGWLHPGAKLVVVWVGNEDDCSTRAASSGGLVWNPGGTPGNDSCTADTILPASQQRQTPVVDYASFFTGLGRPLGAAFIRPGNDLGFSNCACPGGSCGGYSPGTRFKTMADSLRAGGASVVEGSVCDPNFGTTTLPAIADLVKPPGGLKLPSVPAAGVVTQLRILDGSGGTVHACTGPGSAAEWWFVDCDSSVATAGSGTAPSQCVAVKKGSACEPQPGQALQAVYLGQVPVGGCLTSADCQAALGGAAADWTCDGATGSVRGTCLCKTSG